MGYECFDVEVADGVAHIRFNRPDSLNSMIPSFWRDLPEIVTDLSDQAKARVLVVSSTGKHFSAGMDLAVFTGGGNIGAKAGAEMGRLRADLWTSVLRLQESFTAFERARMPVLAAIQGGCIGGAVDLVTACDLRYASADAFFCVQEINIGMTADVGTLQRLPKIVPDGIARELAYTGRRMPAEEAAACGLVNKVFDDHASLVDGTLAVAAEIASKSPLAIWGSKQMLTYSRDHSVADSLVHIATWQTGMFQPADMVESFVAKSEGRPPRFDDLLPLTDPL